MFQSDLRFKKQKSCPLGGSLSGSFYIIKCLYHWNNHNYQYNVLRTLEETLAVQKLIDILPRNYY